MRCFLKILASLLILLMLFSGCQGNNADNKPAGTANESVQKTGDTDDKGVEEKHAIRFIAANHMWTETIKPEIAEFENQTGIKVNMESYAEDQLTQKLTIEFTSGSNSIDVFMTRPLQEARLFFKNNWYETLDFYVNDAGKTPPDWNWADFMKATIKCTSVDGNLIGIPLNNEFQALFYRKDLFEQANIPVPKNLDELEAAAKKLHDPAKQIYGIVSRGKMGNAVSQFSGYLYSFGGDFLKDNKSAIDSPEAVQALKYYGSLLKNYGPPGVINMSWPQASALFASGNAAMYTDGSVMFAQMNDPAKSNVVNRVGLTMFPAGPGGSHPYMIAAWALAIPREAKFKDEAWSFITWSTNKENMTRAELAGASQPRMSVFSDPEVSSKLVPGYSETFQQAAEVGTPYVAPMMTSVVEARDIIGGVIVRSIESGGTGDIEGLAREASAKINELLAQAGEGGN